MLCVDLIGETDGSQMCLQLPLSPYTNTELSCDVPTRPSYRPSHSGKVSLYILSDVRVVELVML